MRIQDIVFRRSGFRSLFGLTALEKEVQKFRELRDSYRDANKAHYGERLAALLDD